jgi:hypothetical protein
MPRQEKDANIGVEPGEPPPQVGDRRARAPAMIDDEVTISKTAMVSDEQLDRGVEMIELVSGRRVGGDKMVAVQHQRTDRCSPRALPLAYDLPTPSGPLSTTITRDHCLSNRAGMAG